MVVLRFISIFLVYGGVQLLVLASVFGAEPMRLSLEQAIQTGLERNLELQAKREEFGIAETIKVARPDRVEFQQLEIPSKFYPAGGHPRESWESLFYANLITAFIEEIIDGKPSQGNFEDGAWVQETINAVETSFAEKRWVTLPLER